MSRAEIQVSLRSSSQSTIRLQATSQANQPGWIRLLCPLSIWVSLASRIPLSAVGLGQLEKLLGHIV